SRGRAVGRRKEVTTIVSGWPRWSNPWDDGAQGEGRSAVMLTRVAGLRLDAPQIRFPLDEEASVGHGGGRIVGAVFQVVGRENLEFGTGLDHVTPPGAGEIDAAVRAGDGAGARADLRRPFLIDDLAGSQFPALDHTGITAAVNVLPDDDGRAARG